MGIKKTNDFARKMSVLAVTRLEGKMVYQSVVMPSMLYSAPAGTLNQQQAAKINSRLTQAALPSMGYNRNSPLQVVYGPTSMGGIGMKDIFAEQGAAKAAAILKHIRADQKIGQAIKCQLKWAQQVAGIDQQILVDTKARIPQLDGEVGLQTLRKFLQLSDMSLEILAIKTSRAATDLGQRDNVGGSNHGSVGPDSQTSKPAQIIPTSGDLRGYCRRRQKGNTTSRDGM
jgi:hypothetical protein